MPPAVKPARKAEFPRRRARARETRRRILEAARTLFVERGYVATTIEAVAERAGVSPETIYATFHNKRSILAEVVDVAIAGGPDAPPILDQGWVDELRTTPELRDRVRILAGHGRAILEGRSDVDEVVRAAAASDPEIATLRDRGRADRYAGQRVLLRMTLGPEGTGRAVDPETAADILYAIGSPEVFRLLVVDRGWSGDRFERWYGDTIERLLLGEDRPTPA